MWMVITQYILELLWSWHISKEIKKKIVANKNIIEAYDSILFGYFCIGFIDFMLKGKCLPDYTNLFSPMIMKKMIK